MKTWKELFVEVGHGSPRWWIVRWAMGTDGGATPLWVRSACNAFEKLDILERQGRVELIYGYRSIVDAQSLTNHEFKLLGGNLPEGVNTDPICLRVLP